MSELALVHDVLDAQLVDRHDRKIGRVDSVVLALSPGRPLRVTTILVGGPVRAERVGRWMVALARASRALGRIRHPGVSAIPFSAVRRIADTIQVEVDGRDLEASHREVWLAEHVIEHIPGAGTESDDKERK
jgi:hypothetical protein